MPTPDSLKIKCYTPIPSEPEVDLDGKMLTKDAKTKDCLFTMTEYLSENVLQGIPKEFRLKQFFDKGLFKSFRKQNPFNKMDNTESAKKEKTETPEPTKKDKPLENPKPGKEDDAKKPEPGKEDDAKKPEPAKETLNQNEIKVGGKDNSSDGGKDNSSEGEKNTVNNQELISTYRRIINHNIRLTLNTLFQKNNKIVIKGNTYTIGYYNWTDYDWDIDAKRPTFDKQNYVTSQSVKQQLKKIPPILKHGLVTTNDKLNAEKDFFSVKVFDNEEDAVKAKVLDNEEDAVKAKALETLGIRKGQPKRDVIEVYDDDNKSRAELIKVEKARKMLGLMPGQARPNGKPQVAIKPELDVVPKKLPDETSTINIVPSTKSNEQSIIPSEGDTVTAVLETTEPNQQSVVTSESDIVNEEVPTTQVGGQTDENNSNIQKDSSNESRRFSDPRYRYPYDPRYHPSYDPRYRFHSKIVNKDESNFAIYISVELYLVKGENLTPEDESNLNCKNKWNQVLVPFDKLIGREKRGILPDYTLEPTSKPESSKTNGKPPTTPEAPAPPNAHGGTRHRSKTHRRKKRKTAKKNKYKKRKAFRTTRKRKLRGSKRK